MPPLCWHVKVLHTKLNWKHFDEISYLPVYRQCARALAAFARCLRWSAVFGVTLWFRLRSMYLYIHAFPPQPPRPAFLSSGRRPCRVFCTHSSVCLSVPALYVCVCVLSYKTFGATSQTQLISYNFIRARQPVRKCLRCNDGCALYN